MAFQYSLAVRNAKLDAIETAIGASPLLVFVTGDVPATCDDPDPGTVLATATLPADWMSDAADGSKSKSGTWEDPSADDSGVCGHFRIYDTLGTCHIQGTVTATGGGGEITLNTVTINAGQRVAISTFAITAGNV